MPVAVASTPVLEAPQDRPAAPVLAAPRHERTVQPLPAVAAAPAPSMPKRENDIQLVNAPPVLAEPPASAPDRTAGRESPATGVAETVVFETPKVQPRSTSAASEPARTIPLSAPEENTTAPRPESVATTPARPSATVALAAPTPAVASRPTVAAAQPMPARASDHSPVKSPKVVEAAAPAPIMLELPSGREPTLPPVALTPPPAAETTAASRNDPLPVKAATNPVAPPRIAQVETPPAADHAPARAEASATPRVLKRSSEFEPVHLAAFLQEGAKPLTAEAKKKVDDLIEADPGDEVSLQIRARRSKILRTKRPLIRTVISDPTLIEMVQFGPREFALIGKQEGTTNVTLWFDQENSETLTYVVTVLPDSEVENRLALKYKEMERMINALFPNSKIRLLVVGDKLIIRGQARDIREATNIYDLVKGQYAKLDKSNDNNGKDNGNGNGNGNGANGGNGALVQGGTAASIGAPPVANIGVPPVGATGLSTTVQLQANGGGGYGGDPNDSSNVINMIEVPGEAQIMLKVRIAEVKRTALRTLGANFAVNPTGAIGNFFFNSAQATSTNPAAIFSDNNVSALINALVANNTMKILAEPNLVTLSGRPASFLSGGSFPVPTTVGLGGIGAASTFFQGYGTQLFFLPTILDKDRIRLQVTPSMSSLDLSTSVNGIPGLTLSTAFTTVDLREGQWLAIAGLLVDRQTGQNTRVPILGDIPAVKVLFANKSIKRQEEELIVLVSPVLVHPMEPKQAPALLPGMDITEPDNWDFFINGRWEGRPDIQYRSTVAPIVKQRVRDAKHGMPVQGAEDFYIQGPRGFSR